MVVMDADRGLALIESSGLLCDGNALASLSAELKRTHEVAQVLRTRTEMEVSVLSDGKHPTADSKYWQSVREQDVQYQNLVMLSFDYRRKQVEKAKLERDLVTEDDELEAERMGIDIEESDYILEMQRREAHHRMREIAEWSSLKAELAPHCQYSLDNVDAHQLATFGRRFDNQASALTGGEGVADRINILGLQATARRLAGGS